LIAGIGENRVFSCLLHCKAGGNPAGHNVFAIPRNYESIHIAVVEICSTIERDVY
jgi:hypothetical protein